MDDVPDQSSKKGTTQIDEEVLADDITREQSTDAILAAAESSTTATSAAHATHPGFGHLGHSSSRSHHHHFRVYKRRWFGLIQLILLNIVVSWDVCGLVVA
jgi:hypothetical protein